jgi:hypothetical protein
MIKFLVNSGFGLRKQPVWFWVSIFVLAIGYLLFSFYFQPVLNPDMLAYLSIAKHYQEFNFPVAFNSYWSPLISWLLALSPFLKSKPILTFRILHIMLGFLLIWQWRFWVLQLLRDNTNRLMLMLLFTIMTLVYSLTSGYAELLSVYCLLLFLRVLFRYNGSVSDAFKLAGTILLSFFAKSFMLPLCVCCLVIFFAGRWILKKDKPEGSMIGTFIAVALGLVCWSVCLYTHYGFFTLNASYSFNTTIIDFDQYAVRVLPYPDALFNWEDPYYFHVKAVYFWNSESYFLIHWNRWVKHWSMTGYLLKYFSYFGWLLLLLPFIIWKSKPYTKRIYWLGYLGVVISLCWFGYSLVLLVERYLIPVHFLLILLVFGLWDVWCFQVENRILRVILLVLLFLTFIKTAYFIAVDEGKKASYLNSLFASGDKLNQTSLLKGKKIVIFQNDFPLYDFVSFSCYLSDGHFLGEIPRDTSMTRICKEYQVDFILNQDSKYPTGIPENWKCVYQDSIMHVSLFQAP